MKDAHKGRGIGNKEFDRVCEHVVNTMKELSVPEELINETAGHLLPLRPDCIDEEWFLIICMIFADDNGNLNINLLQNYLLILLLILIVLPYKTSPRNSQAH